MKKVNFGIALLVFVVVFLSLFYTKVSKNFLTINEKLEERESLQNNVIISSERLYSSDNNSGFVRITRSIIGHKSSGKSVNGVPTATK